MTRKIEMVIDKCSECPFRDHYDGDGYIAERDACSKTGNELTDNRLMIPDWCPLEKVN